MTTTLCGYERETLTCVLKAPSEPWSNGRGRKHRAAYADICNPAKLAELMAEELQRRGVIALATLNDNWWDTYNSIPTIPQYMIIWNDTRLHMHKIERPGSSDVWPLEMPQARAALLRIMQLPEGTPAEDVLKALEVSDAA